MITRLIEKVLGMDRLQETIKRAFTRAEGTAFQKLTAEFGLGAVCDAAEAARIPRTGPVIVVANHPLGFADGLFVPAFLDRLRGDLKVIAHKWLGQWPELAERFFLVDPQAPEGERGINARATIEAARWVRRGGLLFLYPAGEVARYDARRRRICDSPWKPGLGRLVQLTKATVVPLHVGGRNSLLFHLASLIHPRLGAALLVREILGQDGLTVRLRVGRPIAHEELADLDAAQISTRLQRTVEALGEDDEGRESTCRTYGSRSPETESA